MIITDWSWSSHIPDAVQIIILIAAGITALGVIYVKVIKPLRNTMKRWDSGFDNLLGYPAINDPGTGRELKPATPPLGQRVDALEDAMNKLVDQQERMINIIGRIADLEEWQRKHVQWAEDVIKDMQVDVAEWRKEHEAMHLLANEIAKDV